MISKLNVGRWAALGALLTICISVYPPEAAAAKKKPAAESSAASGKAKKKADKSKTAKSKSKKAEPEEAEAEAEEPPPKPAKKAEPKATAKKPKGKGKGRKEAAVATSERKVAVLPFDGPNGKKMRGYVTSTLGEMEGVNDVSDVSSTRENSADSAMAIAKEEGAVAVVYGTASKARGQVVLELVVRNGRTGEVIGEPTFKAQNFPKLKKKINDDLPVELAGTLPDAQAPQAEKPEPAQVSAEEEPEKTEDGEPATEAEEEKHTESEAKDSGGGAHPSPLELGLGVRGFQRSLDYKDDLHDFANTVKEQSTYSGPGVSVYLNFRWYPGAHGGSGPAANIGLIGGYERGFLTKAKPPSGPELDVTSQEFYVGARYRIPIAVHELGINLSFGQQQFSIKKDDVLLPDIKYSYLRPGLDARFRASKVLVGFSFGYRHVLSAGEIQEDPWYPDATVKGFDAGLLGGYALSPSVDLVIGLDMKRYGYTLNPKVGSIHVAGGAVDQYLSASLGILWRMPGSE